MVAPSKYPVFRVAALMALQFIAKSNIESRKLSDKHKF